MWLKHRQGLWVIAEIDDRLVSCVAIVPEGKGVSFSTFACINDIKSKLAGGGVWKQSLKIVRERFDVSFIEIDSWEGNHFINRFLRKRGFKKIRTYPDPAKPQVEAKKTGGQEAPLLPETTAWKTRFQ